MQSQDPEEKKARYYLIQAKIARAVWAVCWTIALITDYAIRTARPNSMMPRIAWPASWALLIPTVIGGFAAFFWTGIAASKASSCRRASQAETKPDSEQ